MAQRKGKAGHVVAKDDLIGRRAQQVSARTLEPFVAFGAALLLYLVLTLLTTQVLQWFERRYRLQM